MKSEYGEAVHDLKHPQREVHSVIIPNEGQSLKFSHDKGLLLLQGWKRVAYALMSLGWGFSGHCEMRNVYNEGVHFYSGFPG